VDIAYLYELGQGGEASWQTVLGVEEPPDRVMANTLVKVAASAGLMEPPLIVRFLPDEPSHRAGLNGLGLEPFYRRPR
jgi:hypothetical protein